MNNGNIPKTVAVNYTTTSLAKLPLLCTHQLVSADSQAQPSHSRNPLEATCLCIFPLLQDADLETMKSVSECLVTGYSKEKGAL